MKTKINPGHEKRELVLIDNVVYSHTEDLQGNPLELKMSILLQNGNREKKAVMWDSDPEEDHSPKPALIWIPGAGWRGADKNQMVGEMAEFVRAGYVVASIGYRNSSQGHFPAQIVDVNTAVRYLRAHSEKYEIDPERIGVFGRSAGAHLAVLAGMNISKYTQGEWQEYSSNVSACCDMFGPVDMISLMELEEEKFKDPNFRWHCIEETNGGALLGGDPLTMKERAKDASPINYINKNMCPLLIFHGDNDPIVPIEVSSEPFYSRIVEMGLEERVEYYVVEHAGHGSSEFFQDSVKQIIVEFFDRYLK